MPDLFKDILDAEKGVKDKPDATVVTPSQSSGSDKASTPKDARSKGKEIKKSESRKSEPDRIDKLASIMETGFSNLQQVLQDCMMPVNEDCDFFQYEEEGDNVESPEVEMDLFSTLSEEITSNDKVGADIPTSLASLANKLLKSKSDNKDKFEKYPRPKNVEFLESPQINKPVWGNLSHQARVTDCSLQAIQRDFLASAVPVLKVMQLVNDSKDDLNSLDPKEIVRMLNDSVSFLGSANVGMVAKRRSLIKKELPSTMHLLCNDSVEFSGSNLFGNSLSNDIKEVSEYNKISTQLKGRGSFTRGRGFGRGRFFRGNAGRGSFFRRGRSWDGKRFNPIASFPTKKGPLNKSRPSKE